MLFLFLLALETAAMFRGGASHTGVFDARGASELHGVLWKFKTNGAVYSSPAVDNGVVFVGSTDGSLYAIDAKSGTQKWKYATKGRITSSPAVQAGIVYFGSYDSTFYALDATTGEVKWKVATAGEKRFSAPHIHGLLPEHERMPDPFDFFLSSPAIANNVVYFGSGDGSVYALGRVDGTVKWKFQTGDVVHASPAVADGTVFIGSWDTYFYALDAATGGVRWKFKTGEDPAIYNQTGIQGSAAVVGGVVYFGCRDSKLYALDAGTGAKLWAADNKGSWVIGSPAIKDGMIYFTTSDSGMFHAVDARTGDERFALSLKWPMFSSPAIAGHVLYIGSHEGKLHAIDLDKRQVAWSFQSDGWRENGARYTQADGGPNYRAAMSSPFFDDVVAGIQKMFSVGAMLSSPAVVGETIYIGSADGNVYAIH